MNIFFLLYLIFLFGYFVSAAAIVYHLVKFRMHRGNMIVTTSIFLVGGFILLLINMSIAAGIDWSDFNINL